MVAARRRKPSGAVAVPADTRQDDDTDTKADVALIDGAELAKAGSSKGQSPSASISEKSLSGRKKRKEEFCVCKGEDDGRPMVRCEGACKNW